jgi:pimeloyl-ACP methyl ester carboxylesterase
VSAGLTRRTLVRGTDRISFLEAGKGAGLIFLHSLGADALLWRPQLRAFQRTNHVVAPDLRGHGETSSEAGLVPAQMADDVSSLARYLRLERVVLVGLSMGANVALMTAATNPALVAGLVLASAFTETSPELKSVLRGVAEEAEKVVDMDEYAALRTRRLLVRATGAARDDFTAGAQKMSKVALVTLSKALADWNLTPLLSAIKIPCLVLAGDADPFVSIDMAKGLAGRIQGSKIVVLPGAGHICNSDSTAEFNNALGEFLMEFGRMPKYGRGSTSEGLSGRQRRPGRERR